MQRANLSQYFLQNTQEIWVIGLCSKARLSHYIENRDGDYGTWNEKTLDTQPDNYVLEYVFTSLMGFSQAGWTYVWSW